MNELMGKIWLGIWHLLPANPILVRVVHGASRRSRHFYLRIGYIGALLIVVVGSLFFSMSGQTASLTDLAKEASQTFRTASLVQLAMMCLLAPVFTAAAITQERDAQTFNILLSTPLTNAQIVMGSLMSRLYFVLMLLLGGLPVFLMTMVYGGVTRAQVFESFALSGSTALLTGSLAICIAMIGVGTRRTIFSFYLAIALYLIAGYLLALWPKTWVAVAPANIDGFKMSFLAPLHPFLALDVSLNRMQAPDASYLAGYSRLARFALSRPAAAYVTWTTMAALVLVIVSVFFVRRGTKAGEMTLMLRIKSFLTIGRSTQTTRPPRSVWVNPVAWREAKTRGQGGGLLRWTLIIGGAVSSLMVLIQYLQGALAVDDARVWLAGLIIVQFAIALIIATNTAATSISKERENMTMDILLTTPVTSKYILWGKLRGLVSFAMPLVIGPVIVLLTFGVIGLVKKKMVPVIWLETGLELGVLMIIYTAIACVVALRISLISRKNVTAVMYSVGILILATGLSSLIFFGLADSAGGRSGAFLAHGSPFSSIWYAINPNLLYDSSTEFAANALSTRSTAAFGVAIAALVVALITYTFYTNLVRNFDMIVRKQSGT
ncbi:MAG: ABC transporter permease subunit [Planctomycetota bacterium]|jgi:ABC-type transport system involved in multi-copper enzyme maturation permease subunit